MSAKAGDTFGVELVQAAGASLTIGNESGVFEDAEVLGDGGTAYGQGAGDFVYGDGTVGEPLEDGHAGGIAQCVKSGLEVSIH